MEPEVSFRVLVVVIVCCFTGAVRTSIGGYFTELTLAHKRYYLSQYTVNYSDVDVECKTYNMEELFIQSNEEYFDLQTWVSNDTTLDTQNIWIKTNETAATIHRWKDGTAISVNAWMTLRYGEHVEPNSAGNNCDNSSLGCCVFLSRTWFYLGTSVDERHYLMDNTCTRDQLFICVEVATGQTENLVTTTMTSLVNLTSSNRPIINACPCPCQNKVANGSHSDEELKMVVDEIKRELIVDKTSLSSTRNKKESAKDDRPSSKTLGVIGLIICVIPPVIFILEDLIALIRFLFITTAVTPTVD